MPCTPLAIVKCLEYIGVYNKLLDYGDRAYGRTVTVINRSVVCAPTCELLPSYLLLFSIYRSEVVGRPLAALLSNDGAHVFSVDIDTVQEYTKRPSVSAAEKPKYYSAHVVHPSNLSLKQCLALSDVVVSAVPSADYKVKTEWLKPGCVCVNVASDKNFEGNVREKVCVIYFHAPDALLTILIMIEGFVVSPRGR